MARNVEWAERLIKAGKSTGVCGIPVCVKDCFHIGGMETSNGTENGVDGLPDRDAAAVAALMEAGAIVVAKTNLPAHSMDVQTFNDRYGVTGTPYNVDFAAGGSSGGSAAAVGAGVYVVLCCFVVLCCVVLCCVVLCCVVLCCVRCSLFFARHVRQWHCEVGIAG